MKRANLSLFLLLISLIVIVAGCVFTTGCLSSAAGRGDMPMAGNDVPPPPHAFPPMYSYPKDMPSVPANGSSGKFLPGDILQPDKGSQIFDPDLAVIIVRNDGDGSYGIGGIAKSDGTWGLMPGSIRGTIACSEVERLFPEKVGHMDISSLSQGQENRT